MSESDLPEHVAENRSYWDSRAHEWVDAGERNWALTEPEWGIWGLPETEVGMFPDDMRDMDAIELGCGTGYVSAWMTRRGAKVVGIDNSAEQLDTARRLAGSHKLDITWLHGNAEDVPCADESFDYAVSEYGAAIWCDPFRWIPEACRLLRPGGTLAFLGTHPLAIACSPLSGKDVEPVLHRPYFGMRLQDWREVEVDPGGMEFNLTVSGWIALFRETGFDILDYQELRAPADIGENRFSIPADWARNWPSEQVWVVRKVR